MKLFNFHELYYVYYNTSEILFNVLKTISSSCVYIITNDAEVIADTCVMLILLITLKL